MSPSEITFAYFGGEPLGIPVLEELNELQLLPKLVVCNPDRPAGRKQQLTPPSVKTWAINHGIEVWQPEDFNDETAVREKLSGYDVLVVVAYNMILPSYLINLPFHKALNMHPSLLPLLRGPSPIRSAILQDQREAVGASVIVLDEEMDHGPIVAQMPMEISDANWPVRGEELDQALARMGGSLLADVLPKWVEGSIESKAQNHDKATYTEKFSRNDGELSIDPFNLPSGEEAYQILLKIRAFDGFPGTFFMYAGMRVKVVDAKIDADQLQILRVIPEGKGITEFTHYISSISNKH